MVSFWWWWWQWWVMVRCQHLESFTKRNMMFMSMFLNSSFRDSFHVFFICLLTLFYIFVLSYLVWSSILPWNLLCMIFFTYVIFFFFIIFATPRTRFVLDQFFIVLYCCGVSSITPVPHLLPSYAWSPALYPTYHVSHPQAAVAILGLYTLWCSDLWIFHST